MGASFQIARPGDTETPQSGWILISGEACLAKHVAALATERELTVYPPAADRRDRLRRIVVKGRDDLAARLTAVLADFRSPRGKREGTIEVEVDPVEWPT